MTVEFCEEILGDGCEPGPTVTIPLPDDGAVFAILGSAVSLTYDREDGSPLDEHTFKPGEVFVLVSPPTEDIPQIVMLAGPGLLIDHTGIQG